MYNSVTTDAQQKNETDKDDLRFNEEPPNPRRVPRVLGGATLAWRTSLSPLPRAIKASL